MSELKTRTMITQEIKLAGKPVTLGYYYATEIAYKYLAGEDFIDYAQHAVESIQQERDPDTKRTICAVLACLLAYYGDNEAPVTDADLMKEAKPAELGMAILTILDLRRQFYTVPSGEPEDKPSDQEGKNAKN